MKIRLSIITILTCFQQIFAQVLITETDNDKSAFPDPSAQLEIRHENKGVYIPQVALNGENDQENVLTPREGTIVFNTNKNIPETEYEGIATWDGNKWLFSNTEKDVMKIIDVVKNKSYDGYPNVKISTFPTTDIFFAKGEDFNKRGWKIIKEENKDTFFENNSNEGNQKIIIDAEGIAAIDNNYYPSGFSYAIGIFIDNKLISVRKYNRESVSGQCVFDKFNIRGFVDSSSKLLNKNARESYNVKLAAIGLKKQDDSSYRYNEIIFGGLANGCSNLNEETAKTYLNILTIERKTKNN
ncbi:hypothetical protein [Ornithobacterium rhinotracheale]|uniref:hypothetical protein n=1 Tax=Ornithobacterium rhinotracheale TaxID=28251 RepID=UPI00403504A3